MVTLFMVRVVAEVILEVEEEDVQAVVVQVTWIRLELQWHM
jgi:hypothetical protein